MCFHTRTFSDKDVVQCRRELKDRLPRVRAFVDQVAVPAGNQVLDALARLNHHPVGIER
jgi:hypothetical protein